MSVAAESVGGMNHFSDTPFPRSADRDGGGAPGVETGGLSGASSRGSSGGLSGASSGDAPSASPGASPFDPSGFAGGFAASVFCAAPALAEDAVADALPEGFAGRLSFRAAETLGYEQSVSALQRLGMLVSWAQAQQARAPGLGRKLPFPGLFSKCHPHRNRSHHALLAGRTNRPHQPGTPLPQTPPVQDPGPLESTPTRTWNPPMELAHRPHLQHPTSPGLRLSSTDDTRSAGPIPENPATGGPVVQGPEPSQRSGQRPTTLLSCAV